MKTRMLFLLAVAMIFTTSSSAQTIEFVVLDRQANFIQTSAGSAAQDATSPYEFLIAVNGQNLGSPFTFSFKKPFDTVTTYAGEERTAGTEWEAPISTIRSFSSMTTLNMSFPAGDYTLITSGHADATLGISNLIGTTNDGFGNTPFVIGTQDGSPVSWSGNMMLVDPTKQLTLTTTTFTTNNSLADNRIGLWLGGYQFDNEVTNETAPNTFTFSSDWIELQISPNMLHAGYTYDGALEFNVIDGSLVDLSGIYGGTASGVAVYTAYTSFSIQAIPEPSTYAAILGALALAGVAVHRRRRAV